VSRSLVSLREAEPTDAEFLVDLWADGLRRAERPDLLADVEQVVKTAHVSPEQRLVIAEHDGERAGAVLLRIATVTPLNLDLAVQVVSPCVVPAFRRRGIGRTLMECAVAFAEEAGVSHVATAVASSTSGSRDGNRFMARLALGPLATMRVAPVVAVRARLTAARPAGAGGGRQLTRVLAARRSARRARPAVSEQ
jgi:GNAT superfamily N-acetyltransferase